MTDDEAEIYFVHNMKAGRQIENPRSCSQKLFVRNGVPCQICITCIRCVFQRFCEKWKHWRSSILRQIQNNLSDSKFSETKTIQILAFGVTSKQKFGPMLFSRLSTAVPNLDLFKRRRITEGRVLHRLRSRKTLGLLHKEAALCICLFFVRNGNLIAQCFHTKNQLWINLKLIRIGCFKCVRKTIVQICKREILQFSFCFVWWLLCLSPSRQRYRNVDLCMLFVYGQQPCHPAKSFPEMAVFLSCRKSDRRRTDSVRKCSFARFFCPYFGVQHPQAFLLLGSKAFLLLAGHLCVLFCCCCIFIVLILWLLRKLK